jgi:putative tryptophan/tyrosine transport system substrate-binding protein
MPSPRSGGDMRRRNFLSVLGAAAVAWPLAARAQQAQRARRIGVLMGTGNDANGQARLAAFREGLLKGGWIEGRNILIDARWGAGDMEAMRRLAGDLVAGQPDLILSATTPTTEVLLKETRNIPIVFAIVSDPLGSGFVASFSRPGGNVTGFTNIEPAMAGKWVELLKEVAPSVSRVALVLNPSMATYAQYYLSSFKAAAAAFGLEPTIAAVQDVSELEAAILAQSREPGGSLVIMTDTFTSAYRSEIISLAARNRLPAVYPYRFFAGWRSPVLRKRSH